MKTLRACFHRKPDSLCITAVFPGFLYVFARFAVSMVRDAPPLIAGIVEKEKNEPSSHKI